MSSQQGSNVRGEQDFDGRAIINQKKGRFEVYNASGELVMKIGWNGDSTKATADTGDYGIVYVDSNGVDKVFQGPVSSGIFEVFFIGILECDITGGSLDGVTYSSYILDIFLNHDFSTQYPDLTPLYQFWREDQTESGGEPVKRIITLGDMGSVSPTGGTSTETTTHQLVKSNTGDEYLRFTYVVDRSAGTVTIAAQTLRLIPAIIYFNEPLEMASATVQGGGGGILQEAFNFYT